MLCRKSTYFYIFSETTLHPVKIGVLVIKSRRRIIGPISFNETINAESYRFLEPLHGVELTNSHVTMELTPEFNLHESLICTRIIVRSVELQD